MNVAEEIRRLMAQLGVRRFEDMIGRTDLLDMREAIDHWKAQKVDLVDGAGQPRRSGGRRPAPDARAPSRCSKTRSTGGWCASARRRSSALSR